MMIILLFSINVYFIYSLKSLTLVVNDLVHDVERLQDLSDKE